MSSQAVIIGAANFDHKDLEDFPSVARSAEEYFNVLSRRGPFGGSGGDSEVVEADGIRRAEGCVLIRDPGTVDQVMGLVLEAAAKATGADDVLLVVYVGHGYAWEDVRDDDTHFAVRTSKPGRPWTWLPWGYLNWAMRPRRGTLGPGLRVLVADCCYSSKLRAQSGAADRSMPESLPLTTDDHGLAIFTPLRPAGPDVFTYPEGCEWLGEPWKDCTRFSGHFLKVLHSGYDAGQEAMKLGEVRDEVRLSMRSCGVDRHHPTGLLLNGPNDMTPFLENAVPEQNRVRMVLTTFEDVVRHLESGRHLDLDSLIARPELAGEVGNWLVRSPSGAETLQRLDETVNVQATASEYARYWRVRDGLAA